MRLTSIAEGTELKIMAYTEFNSLEFATKCAKIYGDAILVEPIKKEEEPISFKSDVVKVDAYITPEGELPVIWKNVSVKYLIYMQEEYHSIQAFSVGYEFNRRKACREFIGTSGSVQIGSNVKPHEVVVKDISSIGFSFVTSEDLDVVKQLAHINFLDSAGESFNLHGMIVRKQYIEDNKIIYGCETTIQYGAIELYILKKQRERNKNKMQTTI